MPTLRTYKFTGPDKDAATAALMAAMDDGSCPIKTAYGQPMAMWITHVEVTPGAMQMPFYELHVTAWVDE